MERTIVS